MKEVANWEENTLVALSDIYISLHIFDLQEDVLYPIKSNEFIDKWSEGFESSQEKLYHVMSNITSEEHRELILNFVNLSTLERRMKECKVVSAIFHGKVNGWCKARFIRMNPEENEKLRYVLFVVECIDEEKKKENHLLYLSQTDLMTGIYNRGYGERMISEILKQEKEGLFCLFDVDKFKGVNDKYGHMTGDKVLIEIAKVLQSVKGERDVVMRLGGDEFAAYFLGIRSEKEAAEVIQQVFNQIATIHIEPMTEGISVSLGAVLYQKGLTFDSIYRLADYGVYDSKANKGNTYTFRK